jgi:hypothetical protein
MDVLSFKEIITLLISKRMRMSFVIVTIFKREFSYT